MTNERLIEEAAQAIHSVAESGAPWTDARMADKDQHRAEARAALAVFEKAIAAFTDTPTDADEVNSEREALRQSIMHGLGGLVLGYVPAHILDRAVNHVFAAGFRHAEAPEPSAPTAPWDCPRCGSDPEDCYCNDEAMISFREAGGFRSTTEPTDDEREAMLNAEGWPLPAVVDIVMKRWSNDNDTIRRGDGDWSWKGLAETAIQALAQAGLLRRSEVPEPSAEHECSWACGVDKHGRDYHAEPQGEPSDAQVEAAAIAIHAVAEGGASWTDARMTAKKQHRSEARAALRAAAEAR